VTLRARQVLFEGGRTWTDGGEDNGAGGGTKDPSEPVAGEASPVAEALSF